MKLDEHEKEAIKKFENLFKKSFNEEEITEEDRIPYFDFALILVILEKVEDSISKEEIREKIEELENLKKGFDFVDLTMECETKIEVLKELLKEE